MPLSANNRGALLMTIAMFGFTCNDAAVKFMTGSMPVGQIVFLRGVIASLLIYLLARRAKAIRPIAAAFSPWMLLRIVSEIGGTMTFLTGLSHIPIGNATAILQALPLAVTMGAALFFAEPVGWRRWSAILVGFVGVLIIVRPGVEGFSPYALWVVSTVGFAAVRDLATRKISSSTPSLYVSTITAPAVALSGLVLDNPFAGEWTTPDSLDLSLLVLAACLLLIGYQTLIQSMREGDISSIAPFRYTSFVHALTLGYLVFGDVPDVYMILGGVLIIGSGLYTFYRERVRLDAREIAAESAPRPTP